MSHADTLDRVLRLLARSRRVLDHIADELIVHHRQLTPLEAGIAEELANDIVALIGHSVTDQSEAPEMFALRKYLGDVAEMDGARPRKVIALHMVYPDGTHTGDCEGCAWAQSQG